MALNINEQARKEANLRLLQRSIDRSISDILGSATHGVLYRFQQSSQSWEKSHVEGSVFLASKNNGNGFVLVILNRNSPENYPIELSKDFQLQHNDPYLIFKQPPQQPNGETVIRGIWFPNATERIALNQLLTQVLQQLQSAPTVPPPAPAAVGQQQQAVLDQGAAFAALLSPLNLQSTTSTTTTTTTTAAAMNGSGRNGTPPTPLSATSSSGLRQSSPSNMIHNATSPTLDKKSLQLALLSLIQDDRFLDLLHAQYLKVAHARANRTSAASQQQPPPSNNNHPTSS